MASEDGGNAFPAMYPNAHNTGMTLRQYAAITLRVPNSGTDWLDAMIRESLRDEFAGQAMRDVASRFGRLPDTKHKLASDCFAIADAMLAARKEAADGKCD